MLTRTQQRQRRIAVRIVGYQRRRFYAISVIEHKVSIYPREGERPAGRYNGVTRGSKALSLRR